MNQGFFVVKRKYSMGADDFTHAATHAGLFVQPQSCHTGKISKCFHKVQILFLVIEDENEDE
jgi:hypothetical protein